MGSFRTQWSSYDESYVANILSSDGDNALYLLTIPFWITILSLFTLLIRTSANYLLLKESRRGQLTAGHGSNSFSLKGIVQLNGGSVVFAYMLARILGCASLVGFSVPGVVKHVRRGDGGAEGTLQAGGVYELWNAYTCAFLLLANVYALGLASASLFIPTQPSKRRLIRHNIAILSSELAVYAYRDLWPLATYTKQPLDLDSEGWILWAKIAALVFTAVVIPLFVPSVYTPVDPERPEKVPHPEQTASLISFHTYSYLTPIVEEAGKVAHLPAEALPPLPDYDRALDLSKEAERHLDPIRVRKGRHVVFGILRTFGSQSTRVAMRYFWAVVSMTIYPLTQFLAPLSVNRLLTVLQSGAERSTDVKPWFWIAAMLVSPIIGSMAFQYYIIVMTRTLADSESILTQLVFDYSLKVRVKAESSEKDASDSGVLGEGAGGGRQKAKNSSSFIGKLNNLVTIDLNNIGNARDLVILFWVTPLQMVGCTVFLYFLLGWSTFVGIAFMVVTLPLPGWLTKVASGVQEEKMKKTDSRSQTVTESMNVIRMIKLFGWERKIQSQIDERRDEELKYIWKGKVLQLLIQLITFTIPTITMLLTYATATLVMKMELTSAKVFSSMILFENMRNQLMQANWQISNFIRGKVSIDRLNNFFKETDLLDAFDEKTTSIQGDTLGVTQTLPEDFIGFRNASFSWNADSSRSGADTPSSQFKLSVPGELEFRKGKINLIVGATGSGKTSLSMALLGEMHFEPTHSDSAFNLPRAGGVSFSVQETWVQNETVRDNILFGSPYDEERYKKVLYQCALEKDLELFEAGDQTEVGERGLTLSGGQKARLTLARAIYSNTEIILLDDVFAALDVQTASWIANKCLKGDLVKGRTVLLVVRTYIL
ncbi:hypothetical protein NMY22_g9759 [Coprinellus aureogranulatus]|nr:hypothetical protein NMY22_g9759 [Coprinellus aureogranulatus]